MTDALPKPKQIPVWLPQAVVVAYLAIALLIFAVIPVLTARLNRTPFMGEALVLPLVTGLVYLVCSLWIFSLRRSSASGRAFAVFAASVALGLVCLVDIHATSRLMVLWTIVLALIGGSLVNLAFVFPQEDRLLRRYPLLQWSGYVPAILLLVYALPAVINANNPSAPGTAWLLEYIYITLAVFFFLIWTTLRHRTGDSPIEHEQVRLVLWGGIISYGPLAIWFLLASFARSLPYSPYLLLPLAIFPVALSYTLQRYRLLRTDYILSRVVLYGVMAVLVGTIYVLLVSGLSLIFGQALSATQPLVIGLTVGILALALNPLRLELQQRIDNTFFRSERAYQERLQNFNHALTNTVDLDAILKLLRQFVDETTTPTLLHIFTYTTVADLYTAATDLSGQPTSDVRFQPNSPLTQFLNLQQASVFISDLEQLPASLVPEKTRLALLGAQVFTPLPGRQHLAGWLALGPNRSGEAYSVNELRFLEALGSQAAQAIERAQVVTNMENRVREMNVLTRVSQGVNVTVTFDDVLELVFAQASQAIPTRDFRLTLYDAKTGVFQHAFYLENDERINQKEGKALPENEGLEQQVIRSGRAILTDDYLRECQVNGVLPTAQNLYSWMGVPLNAGAETIGALTLGSRNPSINYTSAQLNLLQAIADQTAGAIIKTRLLEETQRRARQLTTLNELARQLSSTLEIEPLLENILQSAVDILNCEAGSLVLVDDQTDELVFRVTAGPVAGNLLGKRLPPGSGMVGKSVNTRETIVVNNVQVASDRYNQVDQQTGFSTQALLVTPLQVKDKVIGAIEVLNKNNALPFTREDEELLSAFAGQAAVAIDNARLYTMTDQALSSRVEELSVMQRIDRELNTSLDITRAMRITLEWSMRQSAADAGLIGVIEDGGLRITASQGYDKEELKPYMDTLLPATFLNLEGPITSGQSRRIKIDEEEGNSRLLQTARSQAVIPIRREVNTIGLLLLESTHPEPVTEDTLSFLSRLSDHAAIAISNAQLYTAVQQANIAKSEFVSFVSHELKNPMTSIKGYTELLAAGAVGPVTEPQANFLNTIRANVERMSTLVSDLADVSRIEAGRLKLDFKAVPLKEVAEEVVRSLHRQIEDKGQTLNLNLPETLPQMWVDRTRLNQVLTNLVSNAFKYTPQGGQIFLEAEETANQWDPNGAAKVVHIWVQDSGIGISPEDQGKIFQKFFRSEDPKTREAPGTGLGLNITKSLVEMQGGRIWFESEFRKGTTFHFTIPVAEQ